MRNKFTTIISGTLLAAVIALGSQTALAESHANQTEVVSRANNVPWHCNMCKSKQKSAKTDTTTSVTTNQ